MYNWYKKLGSVEMAVAILFLVISVTAIFLSAVMRVAKMPIRWGLDVALLLFTWSTFLGADLAFRQYRLVRVDMLINKLPAKIQKALEAIVYLLILTAVIFMIIFGTKLTYISRVRSFQAMPGLSYSLITASVPVSMFLMLITAIVQIYDIFFQRKNNVVKKQQEA
jgi:TRAP-type C4-dicarboxylate transport system permease small subunit